MKKYRITSIPQSLPKAQRGWFKNRRKRISGTGFQKRNKSSQDIEYEEEEDVPVQKIERNSAAPLWEPQSIPVFPNQDFSIENVMPKRTAEEQANTFAEPFFWSQGETIPAHDATYMVQSDPFGNSFLRNLHNQSLAGQMGISYSGDKMIPRTVNIPEKFIPDYFKPVTKTGENLKCTDGKIAYKGQCVTQDALEIILQRELEIQNFQDNEEFVNRQIKFNNELLEQRKKNYELQQKQAEEQRQNKINEYLADFKKSKKKDVIRPLEILPTEDLSKTIPVVDKNGNPVIDKKTGEPKTETIKDYFKKFFLVIDDYQGTEGLTALWPLEVVGQRILNKGFQPTQFKTLWKFNDNEVKQVKEQVGDVMKQAKDIYDATAYKRIFDNALKLGIDPEEAAKIVAGKNSSFGYASVLKRDYAPKVEKVIDDAIDKFFKDAKANIDKENYSYTTGFNFAESTVPVYGKDANGKEIFLGNTFDPITAHAEWWVDQGKTEKEKQSRRQQVEAIRNKTYADINKYYADVSAETYINPNVTRSDRMETLQEKTNQVNATNANRDFQEIRNAATQDRRYEELAKLTDFSKYFNAYMLSQNGEQIKQTLKNVYNKSNLTDAEKAKLLNALNKKDTQFVDTFLKNKYTNAFGQNADQIISQLLNPENLANRWQNNQRLKEHNQTNTLTSSAPRSPLTTGEKVWDALSNLDRTAWAAGQAFGSGRDFNELMWGSGTPTRSNNEWRELARKDPNLKAQFDQRDWLNYNPISMVGETLNAFNPVNWADEMNRGYNESGWSGLRDRTSELAWEAVNELAKFVPAGQAASLVKNLATAKNVFNTAKGVGKVLPALNLGFTGLNYGLNKLGYPGKVAVNYFNKGALPFTFDAITEYIPEGVKELSEGNTGAGIWDISVGALGVLPPATRVFKALKTGELTPGLRQIYPEGTSYAKDEQTFRNLLKPEYRNLTLQLHPDLKGGSDIQFKNLQNLMTTGYTNIPFNANMQTGIITPRYQFGRWSAGKNIFQPKTLEELLQIKSPTYAPGTNPTPITDPTRSIGFKNGGYLPKAQGGLIKLAQNLSKSLTTPISSTISTLRKIPSTYTAISQGGNLFQKLLRKDQDTYLLNPFANKLGEYNRVVGPNAIADLLQSGLVRAGDHGGTIIPGQALWLGKRTTTWPSFGKGIPTLDNVYAQRIIQQGKTPYIISTNRPMKVSEFGRHGRGSTQFPVDESGKYMVEFPASEVQVFEFGKPHWLTGYKPINTSKQLLGFGDATQPTENIFSNVFKRETPDWVLAQRRFNSLPELNNKEATEVLESFRTRIKTPEGQKRLKDLGITDTKILDDLKILADDETLGQYWLEKIGLNPNLPEISRVTRHEIEHAVQEAREVSLANKYMRDVLNLKYLFKPKQKKLALQEIQKGTTDIDESLKDLELRKIPEKVDWDALQSFGKKDPNSLIDYMSDIQRATNYFDSGSGGAEKSAFLAEVQQYMMNNNIIPKNSYVEVTPEMVKETFNNAMHDEVGKGKYLRLFNIMKPTEANYKLVAKNLNKMLSIAPYIILGAGALQQEQDGGMVMDLSDKEIDQYIKDGYIIEDE